MNCVLSFPFWTSHALNLVMLPLKPNLDLSSLSRIWTPGRSLKYVLTLRRLRFRQILCVQSQLLVAHPPPYYYAATTTACSAVMSYPCSRRAPCGSVEMFCSTWSTSWACWPCCTWTAFYGLSVTRANMHVRCVAPESPDGRERVFLILLLYFRNWENGGKGYL